MSLGRRQKHKIILCVACSIFLSAGVVTFGQTMPIAQAVADKDGNFVPEHSGERVTIRGVITTIRARHFSYRAYYFAYVQDESGAVIVHGEGEVPNISEKDMVEVRGIVGQRHGMAEISSPEFVKLGTALVIPTRIKIGQINSDRKSVV